jgi:hypothetical protein
VNLWELEKYLIEDHNWGSRDAAWVIRRIQTGLDILNANRRF